MEAARSLANQGYPTYLVERNRRLGGQALSLHETWRGESVRAYLSELIEDVELHPGIQVFLGAEVDEVEGFVGNFRSMIRQGRESRMIEHGVTIVATGALEYKPREHLYGEHPNVVTGLELQDRLIRDDPSLHEARTAVFLQCVGSRIPERPYCSKVCCTQSIKSALALKGINPSMRVFVVYRDMRPYGLREDLYREAREAGVVFIRYLSEEGFDVVVEDGRLQAAFTDTGLNRRMEVHPDLLVLASAVVPSEQSRLAQQFKISRNDDGFFAEAHVKLRPVDFSTEGVFVCGLGHAPKPVDESIAQAQAAAARAATLLAAERIPVSGTVAAVDPDLCSMCGVCASVCPYSAPGVDEKTGRMRIQSTLCKGCGLCAASCRSGAIRLNGFDNNQILAMIEQA
jgi:heterodisulfide reductase subunit A